MTKIDVHVHLHEYQFDKMTTTIDDIYPAHIFRCLKCDERIMVSFESRDFDDKPISMLLGLELKLTSEEEKDE